MQHDANFERLMKTTFEIEGGFLDDDRPNAGKTMWGILESTWLRYCAMQGITPCPIEELTKEQAKDVYYELYWRYCRCDKIRNYPLAALTFDIAVNSGQGTAGYFLQEAYNTIRFADDESLVEDGVIGPHTLACVNSYLPRYEIALLEALGGRHNQHYRAIGDRDNIRGWMNRCHHRREAWQNG